ncbi:MAG: M20/M25/M40 family metallo-hydrolase [Solirubrobacterales bacterium]|nr:M20/M25/M40 family metallo-hydrolase [Solirubrobacterales bacterium]MBV9944843.1 M20/M25/M40 family metallo-hydrolase [Solirubrobacterales bacterium]
MIDAAALAEFAEIPAPTGEESARLAWLERRLSAGPGSLTRDAVGNLVWRFGSPRPPALLLMAHVDTVFAGLEKIEISREGDALVGPGIGDNAAAVIAVTSVLEEMPAVPTEIAVVFTVGEEGLGNLRGALHACRELRPELAIAVEGHGLDEVVIEHVGNARARLRVTGPGGHSWSDRGTPSAIHALLEIGSGLAHSGANIGTISGGEAVNAIAAHAELLVERRSLEQPELDAFDEEVRRLRVDEPLSLECEIVGRRPTGRLDPDHRLVQAIVEVRRSLGLPCRFDSGSTDANAAAAFGIPAVSIGCTRGSGMHTRHERIELEPLDLGCRQLRAVIEALAG